MNRRTRFDQSLSITALNAKILVGKDMCLLPFMKSGAPANFDYEIFLLVGSQMLLRRWIEISGA